MPNANLPKRNLPASNPAYAAPSVDPVVPTVENPALPLMMFVVATLLTPLMLLVAGCSQETIDAVEADAERNGERIVEATSEAADNIAADGKKLMSDAGEELKALGKSAKDDAATALSDADAAVDEAGRDIEAAGDEVERDVEAGADALRGEAAEELND